MQRDHFYAPNESVIVFASHAPNVELWLATRKPSWTLRNVGTDGTEILNGHLKKVAQPSPVLLENHETAVVCLDPYYYELKWKELKLPVLAQLPEGYCVALSSLATAFKTECSYNLYGKRIGYMTETERLLIIAILHGYRIPLEAVTLVPLQQTQVLELQKILDKTIDVFITYVIPNSLYFSILRTLPVSLMGWQNIDMDRIRLYHPFVRKDSITDIKTTFATPSPRAQLMVMDREKDSSLLALRLNLYHVWGPKPSTTLEEGFITRLDMPEQLIDPAYQCYGDLTVSHASVCDSKYDVSGMPKGEKTKWDRSCFQDNECPFFQANKNYKNNRGGCVRGKCELPIGVYRESYRYFKQDFPYTPMCYQCKDPGNANCCAEQMNKKTYPNLKSPDYAFVDDKDERIKAKLPYFVSIE